MTHKQKMKIKPSRNLHYRSEYRNQSVVNSFENYDERVKEALQLIYEATDLTVHDFETAFVSKLLSDDLVEACNGRKFDLNRHSIVPQTHLRLTKLGCERIDKSYVKSV